MVREALQQRREREMTGLHCAALVAFIAAATAVTTAHADEAADKAAITARLNRWTADFNAKDPAGVCDLFAPDLAAVYRGVPDRDFAQLCDHLR